MSSVVDRDGQTQVNFGEYIIEFADLLKVLCEKAKGHIDDARDNIKADEPVDAMNNIEELFNEILDSLPDAVEFGEYQKKLGKSIIEAEEYKFKKR